MTQSLYTKIINLISPTIEAMGFELWELKLLQQGQHSLIRIYVDSPSGIKINDCALLSEQLGAIFDLENIMKNRYTLEVSSPGMDRSLNSQQQYKKYLENKIVIKLRNGIAGQKIFKGKHLEANDLDIVLECMDKQNQLTKFNFPYQNIEKANLVPNFEA